MKFRVKAIAAALGAMGALAAGQAMSAGFQLLEQNGSQLGNAYAGTAAAAEDASTIYFNPAGMSFLPGTSAAVSLDMIRPSAEFSPTVRPNPLEAFPPGSNTFDTGGDAGGWAALPAMYFSYRLNPKVDLGLSFNAPFGLKTEYTPSWIGRYQGIESELKTYTFSASGSYKVTETVAIGFGLSAERAQAKLTSALTPAPTSQSSLTGDDWAYGWNIGILAQATPQTRVGFSYRSQIKHEISGTVALFTTAVPGLTPAISFGTPANADLTLPAIATLSATHQLNPQWELLADIAWTQWSKFEQLLVTVPPSRFFPRGIAQNVPENWEDTWRFAVGTNYKYNEKVKLRFGLAYDQSPVDDLYRTVRIPDNDRIWVALGVQFKLTPKDVLDIGYAYLFIDESTINAPAPGTGAGTGLPPGLADIPVVGTYDNSVNILGFQYSRSF